MSAITRDDAAALDAASPTQERRALFDLPESVIYLDGNSLGALPSGVAQRMAAVISGEWGRGLIRSWNDADWMKLSTKVARRIAPLISARAEDLHLGDSTSVSLFKTMVAATRMRPDRKVIVVESSTFPTDGYVAAGVADLLGLELRWCESEAPLDAVDDSVALVSLTHVDFRTGSMFNMPAITEAVHAHGALMQWDLCHSVGAVRVDLTSADADFAVGCTYKYLNGGPGSPAFTWVTPRLQAEVHQPITGWIGHADPFAMSREYTPAPGISRLASGTPPVLALSALDAALTVFEDISMTELRTASLSLTDLFIALMAERLPDLEILTPREHDRRGSQVSVRHTCAYGIVQALIARGVIGDFRDPDIARFGFAPLYVRHVDVYDAVEQLVAVMQDAEYADPTYSARNPIT